MQHDNNHASARRFPSLVTRSLLGLLGGEQTQIRKRETGQKSPFSFSRGEAVPPDKGTSVGSYDFVAAAFEVCASSSAWLNFTAIFLAMFFGTGLIL
jgi:hypothetical protein